MPPASASVASRSASPISSTKRISERIEAEQVRLAAGSCGDIRRLRTRSRTGCRLVRACPSVVARTVPVGGPAERREKSAHAGRDERHAENEVHRGHGLSSQDVEVASHLWQRISSPFCSEGAAFYLSCFDSPVPLPPSGPQETGRRGCSVAGLDKTIVAPGQERLVVLAVKGAGDGAVLAAVRRYREGRIVDVHETAGRRGRSRHLFESSVGRGPEIERGGAQFWG